MGQLRQYDRAGNQVLNIGAGSNYGPISWWGTDNGATYLLMCVQGASPHTLTLFRVEGKTVANVKTIRTAGANDTFIGVTHNSQNVFLYVRTQTIVTTTHRLKLLDLNNNESLNKNLGSSKVITGMQFDERDLWFIEPDTPNVLTQVTCRGSSVNEQKSFNLDSGRDYEGITFDGRDIYLAAYDGGANTTEIQQWDHGGEVKQKNLFNISSVSTRIHGLAFDGRNLWVSRG